jgi:hypothetical protein
MKVVTSINPLLRAFLVTPSIVGMTLALSTTSSLAQSQQPVEPVLGAAETVSSEFEQLPIFSLLTAPSKGQAAALPADNAMTITQTSVRPLVSAEVALPVPGSPHPSLSFTSLQTPVESIAQSSQVKTKLDTDTKIENIGDTKVNAPMVLAQATDSRDLQTTGARSPNGDFLPAMLSQSANSPETQPTDSAETSPESTAMPPTGSPEMPPADSTEVPTATTQPTQWHFLFVPYLYLPFSISGSADFRRGISRDFDLSPSEIRTQLKNSLNFAFFGALEAWTPDYHLGLLANLDYLSLSTDSTFTRSARFPRLADFVPTEVKASVNTQLWYVDLAANYRFYDQTKVNPKGVTTEFDLGPMLFDVGGGINITSINSELDLSTNLGGSGNFDGGKTIVSPLLNARFRWNATPRFAVVLAGSVSGFGISGLTQYGFRGGIDWMFSGNTSLVLGYRFGSLNYNSNSSDFNLDTNQNGPYLGFGFRF